MDGEGEERRGDEAATEGDADDCEAGVDVDWDGVWLVGDMAVGVPWSMDALVDLTSSSPPC